MPNYVNLWHAKDVATGGAFRNCYVTWDGSGNVTFSSDGEDNAWAAWWRLKADGWSDAAVAAVVGMQCWESGLNPWRWQSDNTISYYDTQNRYVSTTHGYGLPQWTPQAYYSDPETWFRDYLGQTIPASWKTFFDSNADFRSSFAPHYSDVLGRPSDGDAQCHLMDFLISNPVGIYFRGSGTYTYGYMPASDFKNATLGTYYQSGDTNSTNPSYTITLDILIYQWLKNFGRGAAETTLSTAVRSNSASYLYQLYTGSTPPTPPVPPSSRRKMPLWMMLRPMNT